MNFHNHNSCLCAISKPCPLGFVRWSPPSNWKVINETSAMTKTRPVVVHRQSGDGINHTFTCTIRIRGPPPRLVSGDYERKLSVWFRLEAWTTKYRKTVEFPTNQDILLNSSRSSTRTVLTITKALTTTAIFHLDHRTRFERVKVTIIRENEMGKVQYSMGANIHDTRRLVLRGF